MKDKIGDIFMWVLLIITLIVVLAIIFFMYQRDVDLHTPCEELIQRKITSRDYAPLPKRCMKGE
jgi:uncharacterized membrane protein